MALEDFAFTTYKEAYTTIQSKVFDWMRIHEKYDNGDHWQEGEAWVGPSPTPDHPDYLKVKLEIERGFVSQNVVAEVLDNHIGGVLSREPMWKATLVRNLGEGEDPTPDEVTKLKEAESLLTKWWDHQDVLGLLQQMVRCSLNLGRGSLRPFVPLANLGSNFTLTPGDPFDILDILYLEVGSPYQSCVYQNSSTMKKLGIFWYKKGDLGLIELSYIDESGLTVFKLLDENETLLGQTKIDLGGHLMLIEITTKPLITQQVIQNQAQLNKDHTMMGRNSDLAGFIERTILNAQMPGHFEKDNDGYEKFIPDAYYTGAGSTTFLVGAEYTQPDGNKNYLNPSIVFREPINPEVFIASQNARYRTILREVHQLHTLLSGDASPSGESRRQAMANFLISLYKTKTRVDLVGRHLLETILHLVSTFSNQSNDYFSGIRVDFGCIINSGPIDPAELSVIMDLVAAEIISLESARGRVGIEDPQAEGFKIQQEREARQLSTTTIGSAVVEAFTDGQ